VISPCLQHPLRGYFGERNEHKNDFARRMKAAADKENNRPAETLRRLLKAGLLGQNEEVENVKGSAGKMVVSHFMVCLEAFPFSSSRRHYYPL